MAKTVKTREEKVAFQIVKIEKAYKELRRLSKGYDKFDMLLIKEYSNFYETIMENLDLVCVSKDTLDEVRNAKVLATKENLEKARATRSANIEAKKELQKEAIRMQILEEMEAKQCA